MLNKVQDSKIRMESYFKLNLLAYFQIEAHFLFELEGPDGLMYKCVSSVTLKSLFSSQDAS